MKLTASETCWPLLNTHSIRSFRRLSISRSLEAGRRHLNRLSPGHTLTSLIQGLGVVRFPGLKRDIRSIGLQKAAEWRFAMIIGHAGAWPITIGPDDGPGLRYQRRKTASACAGWAAKWRIMLAMDCRG